MSCIIAYGYDLIYLFYKFNNNQSTRKFLSEKVQSIK